MRCAGPAAVALLLPVGSLHGREFGLAFGVTTHGSAATSPSCVTSCRRPGRASGRCPRFTTSLGRTDLVWIDVQATSYFSIMQTAGVMFNRQTAEEIQRRISDRQQVRDVSPTPSGPISSTMSRRSAWRTCSKLPFDRPDPTEADLVRLCQEPGLDFVVIPQEFPGLYSASNGRIFVYECYKVRSACCVWRSREAPATAR